MEASVFQAPAAISRTRVTVALPPLRLRSDEQLVALFRRGHDEAFRAIYDRYHKRLLAYARQMLPRRQDAEDVLQDVFVRAYFGLRAHSRDLALRAWLFRVAHNRCIDELRRPAPPPPEVLEMMRSGVQDPVAEVESREVLRRLIADVRRLPEQQRSALLMRELDGMSYEDLAASLGVTVSAVKSLLVRARVGLARATEARDTACVVIREELVCAHDQGVRPNAIARRHMKDCPACRSFRGELRGISRGLSALVPALGPIGALARLWAGSGTASRLTGGATGSGAGASGPTASSVGALGAGGTASSAGMTVGINHLAALIAAAAATGGAVEIQHTLAHSRASQPLPNVRVSGEDSGSAASPRAVIYGPNGRAIAVSQSVVAPLASALGNGSVRPSPTQPAATPQAKLRETSGVAPQTPAPPTSSGWTTPPGSTSSSAAATAPISSLGIASLTTSPSGSGSPKSGSASQAPGSPSSDSSSGATAPGWSSGKSNSSTANTSPATTSPGSGSTSGGGAHTSASGNPSSSGGASPSASAR